MKDFPEFISQLTEGNNDFSDKNVSHSLNSSVFSYKERVASNERVPETKWTTAVSSPIDELISVYKVLGTDGKTVSHNLYANRVFTVAYTNEELLNQGLLGEQFTIKYGTISRHYNKDKEHILKESEWKLLSSALQSSNLEIHKYKDKDTYRIYTNIFRGDKTLIVGVSVKHGCHGERYNDIQTLFYK